MSDFDLNLLRVFVLLYETRSVTATALKVKVLGAASPFLNGSGLIDGTVGKVTCGPNSRVAAPPTENPTDNPTPSVPTVVDSGMAGHADHTARNVLGATAALLLMAGTAGLVGYRRMLGK